MIRSALQITTGLLICVSQFGTFLAAQQSTPAPEAPIKVNSAPRNPLAAGDASAKSRRSDVSLVKLHRKPLTIYSNAAAGCSIWEFWARGVQFINDYDYGRQMQAAFYPHHSNSALGEAGDQFGTRDIPVAARHPSPCASIQTHGRTQTSLAIPLEWNPQHFGGGKDTAILYPNTRIGKSITLDWVGPDEKDRNWPLALYETIVQSPAECIAVVEAPTGYLNQQFNRYYTYDPISKALTPYSAASIRAANPDHVFNPPLPRGPQAVILASGTGSDALAMGVYINDLYSGFVFVDNSDTNSGGQYGSGFTKWEVHYDGGLPRGEWRYKTWIAADSVKNLMADFDQLYAWRVKSR